MHSWQWENIATMAVTSATVIGLYYLGAGAHAGWGFLLMLNLNAPKSERK